MTGGADRAHMGRAIALARARVGRTGSNPAVGCVIVKDGAVIGEAATGEGGRPHAEEQALDQANKDARGAVAYVTLEPCGARSADGVSCSARLASAGVVEVVIACDDASPYARGRGIAALEGAGILVRNGVLTKEAAPLYLDYKPAS